MKTAILFVTHIYNEDIKRQIVKLFCHIVCRLSGRQGANHAAGWHPFFPLHRQGTQ